MESNRFSAVVVVAGLVLLAVMLSVPAADVSAGEFGYAGVYRLDEWENWIMDEDGTWAEISRGPGSGTNFSGNSTGITLLSASATVDEFENTDIGSVTDGSLFAARSAASNGSSTAFYESDCGIFRIDVIALPFDDPELDDMVWDTENQWFYLSYTETLAKWQHTYRVINRLGVPLCVVEVKDRFGAELDIYGDPYTGTGTEPEESLVIEAWEVRRVGSKLGDESGTSSLDTGTLVIYSIGNDGFSWSDFCLAPGEWAELTLVVATGKNPAGKQSYTSCGHYDLSAGALKYTYEGQSGKGQQSLYGTPFRVSVCTPAPPGMCIEVRAGLHWFVRKPGDFFAKALESTVTVEGDGEVDVGVVFSQFANLRKLPDSDEAIPVLYYPTTTPQEPQEDDPWISPEVLNQTEMVLLAATGEPATLDIWQRVAVGMQTPCSYENTGVVTFTLVNTRPYCQAP